jgi:hypothetical protein
MNNALIDINSLNIIDPESISFYLAHQGWERDETFNGDNVWVFLLEDGRRARVLLPSDRQSPDYASRIYDLVRVLSRVEKRSEIDILVSIKGSLTTALERTQQVVNLRLSHGNKNLSTIPISKLGPLLTNLQILINAIAQYEEGCPTESGPISQDIISKSQFSVITTFKGSFGISLANEVPPGEFQTSISDILEPPLIQRTLDNFMSLLAASTEEKKLKKHLIKIKKRAASGYKNFLISLASAETNNIFEWGSPDKGEVNRVELSYFDVINAIHVVNQTSVEEPTEVEIEMAEWMGGYARKEDFELVDLQTGEVYRGEVSPSAMGEASKATWHAIYRVTLLQELTIDQATQSIRKKFTLIDLTAIESELYRKGNEVKQLSLPES